jgi:hypothetical protein
MKGGCNHNGQKFKRNCPACKHNSFIEKSINIHGNLYDYSMVEYSDNKTKVKLKCKIHGEFLITPSDHVNSKSGCSKCHFDKLSNKFRKTKERFIVDAIKVHGNKYDYSLVDYKNNKTEVIIRCKNCNFIFRQIPDKHTNHLEGCPKCRKSKGEVLITTWLENNHITHTTQKSYEDLRGMGGGKLKYDFYILDKNLLIEYDGMQHFQRGYFNGKATTNEARRQAKIHDRLKTEYAYKHNIGLLRIPYTKINKMEEVLVKNVL